MNLDYSILKFMHSNDHNVFMCANVFGFFLNNFTSDKKIHIYLF